MWNSNEMQPENHLDEFGRALVRFVGADPDYLPTDRNPITQALMDDPTLVERLSAEEWFDADKCRMAVSRAATFCQMKIYNEVGGPDKDNERKSVRRHWYHWYKAELAQPLSRQLGDEEFKDLLWNGRLSKCYGWIVDNLDVTYWDLWVKDDSRRIEQYYEELFHRSNLIVTVEKDSLFGDFKAAASALGAKVLVSGKGKMSKAGTEKILMDHFGWRTDYDPFSDDQPLVILSLTDWDYDGKDVIFPTFAEQARRYTSHVLEARVGIVPSQVPDEDWDRRKFEAKTRDRTYVEWAEKWSLFKIECPDCDEVFFVIGTEADHDWAEPHECPNCLAEQVITVKRDKKVVDQPYGFEIEAVETRTFYPFFVEALLSVMDYEDIIDHMRDECRADHWAAADEIASDVAGENPDFQELVAEIERLEAIRDEFIDNVKDPLRDLGEDHVNDWRDDPWTEDQHDPESEVFVHHVRDARSYTTAWRPFSIYDRTAKLVEWLKEEVVTILDDIKQERIDWRE